MEWLIAIAIFYVLAKRGLKAQGKSVDIKGAASTVAANTLLEVCDVLEIEVQDTSTKGKRA
mgnify:CR=1 FL=1